VKRDKKVEGGHGVRRRDSFLLSDEIKLPRAFEEDAVIGKKGEEDR